MAALCCQAGHSDSWKTDSAITRRPRLKQKALDRTAPPHTRTVYMPPDKLLAFLESL